MHYNGTTFDTENKYSDFTPTFAKESNEQPKSMPKTRDNGVNIFPQKSPFGVCGLTGSSQTQHKF